MTEQPHLLTRLSGSSLQDGHLLCIVVGRGPWGFWDAIFLVPQLPPTSIKKSEHPYEDHSKGLNVMMICAWGYKLISCWSSLSNTIPNLIRMLCEAISCQCFPSSRPQLLFVFALGELHARHVWREGRL